MVCTHKGVDQCCVVRYKDPDHSQGDLPVAFVVKSKEWSHDLQDELERLCEKELPEYVQPVMWKFIDQIPLTPIGKVDYLSLEKEN